MFRVPHVQTHMDEGKLMACWSHSLCPGKSNERLIPAAMASVISIIATGPKSIVVNIGTRRARGNSHPLWTHALGVLAATAYFALRLQHES